MNRIIYVGMDVHKDTYSLCSFDSKQSYVFSELTVKAETSSVLSYLKNVEKHFVNDDVLFVCGYEAGPTGFSLCRDLQKKDISCVVMAPSSLATSPDAKKRKTDKIDARQLALHLAHNSYKAVHVITPEMEAIKELTRTRASALKAQKERNKISFPFYSEKVWSILLAEELDIGLNNSSHGLRLLSFPIPLNAILSRNTFLKLIIKSQELNDLMIK